MACWAVDPFIRWSVWFVVDAVVCDRSLCLSSGEAHCEWLWFVWWKAGFYIRFVRLARRTGFISSAKLSSQSFSLSLFFLFPPFPVIVGSIVVLLSFYCRSIVFLLSFHCRPIVNLLMVLCFPLLFFVFPGFPFFYLCYFFCLCYFLSLFELCEVSLSSFRHNRSLSVGRYHVVILPFLSRRFLCLRFQEFLVVFLDYGWYGVKYCVIGFICDHGLLIPFRLFGSFWWVGRQVGSFPDVVLQANWFLLSFEFGVLAQFEVWLVGLDVVSGRFVFWRYSMRLESFYSQVWGNRPRLLAVCKRFVSVGIANLRGLCVGSDALFSLSVIGSVR